jgi:FAD/FMN-containing dehydrogenase/Fe-S oxidoreductase
MKGLAEDLQHSLKGEFYHDDISKRIYSIDASIYQVTPTAVVVARDSEDISKTIAASNRHKVPVIARGAATGINGGCIGSGVIIDTSKYMQRIVEINYEDGYALCQPGVVQDQLNKELAAKGYCLGPDTSTGNRATIGGMLGNNAAGAHSLRYGKMVDHVLSARTILANGEVFTFTEESEESFKEKMTQDGSIGAIFKCVYEIMTKHKADIDEAFPKIQRRVSGYNLDEIVKGFPLNMAKIIVGSEGTFGITDLIKVKISRKPAHTILSVLHFDSFDDALRKVKEILKYEPFSLELIDNTLINLGKDSPLMKNQLNWLKGEPEVLLVAEFDGSTPGGALKKQQTFTDAIAEKDFCYANVSLLDAASQAKVWKLRKAGLGILMSKRSKERATAFLEDVSVPLDKLPEFLKYFKKHFTDAGKEIGFYGHAGVGCVHVRPMIDLSDDVDRKLMVDSMNEIAQLVKDMGGALSGEHGDGLTRSWLNEKMFGPKVYQLFKGLKKAFDPDNLMNPGKIVNAPGPLENLKVDANTSRLKLNSQFHFADEGGWNFAVDMCNGNGECTKKDAGLMCPSYQAYEDEKHSTRARAQSLQYALNGGLPHNELTGKKLHDVLDLCIQCKGCKTECPSGVDMAKMKSEYLNLYQEKNGSKLRDRLFAHVSKNTARAAKFPSLFNFANSTLPAKWLMQLIGITPKRDLPHLADKPFSYWLKTSKQLPGERTIVLFNDTFNEFNTPKIGMYATNILQQLGFKVENPPYTCCGRSLISKGFLKEAKKQAQKLVTLLLPYAKDGKQIVGLEPSCILTIADEYPELLNTDDAKLVAKACITIDDLLAKEIDEGRFDLQFYVNKMDVLMHAHCHQKALTGTDSTLKVLNALPGVTASEVDSGCCGMAGSFGYEKEHYDFSMAIGEKRLFPAIRKADVSTEIISNGTSCRCQISHGARRNPQHLVEFINARLQNTIGSTII